MGMNGAPFEILLMFFEVEQMNSPFKNCIDLYYQHHVDPNTPIEDTVCTLAKLVKEGKVKYIGLSECSAETLRRMEYSPWTLDIETNGIMKACCELGVIIVGYSPLGRGFLTGKYKNSSTFSSENFGTFQGDNIVTIPVQKNQILEENIEAAKIHLTPGESSEIRQLLILLKLLVLDMMKNIYRD
ncbi:aldo/keto reductase [Rhizophagus clarus]|uniref:Aldo/keto reductase n=2 Tax=Rhizophagus clarus TaxID=94130 RepID=A0A8H3KS75_9GLOM|nr:aldo/keto reductase [Rhizophagus clarus]